MPGRYRLTNRGFFVLICLLTIILGGVLLAIQAAQNAQIAQQNERYRQLKSATALPAASATPVPTPDDGTVRIALPTEPPRDETYAMLSAVNPDFCGWLTAGKIDLPVVHRLNDNESYLSVSFSGEESIGGTLFVDGFNRLYPPDMLTVIYGHNMNSGDMFGSLSDYLNPAFMAENPIVRFDTVYAEGTYVPFAVFTEKADAVDIRQFQLSVEEFNAFTDMCRRKSAFDTGVDVRFGDRLLALVTCEGRNDDRLFLLCRALRDGESEMDAVMRMNDLTE